MQSRSPLMLHLGILLAVKLAVLALIWLLLFLPHRLDVDAGAMEQRLASPSSPGAADDRSHAR